MGDPLQDLLDAPRGTPLALLHSCGAGPSWLCTDPVDELTLSAGEVHGAFDRLDAFLQRNRSRRSVGWLGYDLGLDLEPRALHLAEDHAVPVLHVVAYGTVREYPAAPVPSAPAVQPARHLRAHVTRADYERRVAAVVEHIRAGDIFQANLSQPFTAEWHGDPRLLFWRACEQSPAPFAGYLEDGKGTALVCSSPEEFVHLEGGTVRTRPIKGTRPRGTSAAQDAALLVELLESEKDCAELAMIVDLLRNDLGKVAVPGTVRVGPFPEHGSYAQVHHLYATVTATMRAGAGIGSLLRATFPGGSVTGCPKIRCLEILEQLEVARRGIYTGAMGWFGPGEAAHLNIVIRSMVVKGTTVRCNAGGGITSLSDPAREFEETLHKLAGIERTLQCRASWPVEGAR